MTPEQEKEIVNAVREGFKQAERRLVWIDTGIWLLILLICLKLSGCTPQ